MKSIKMTVPWLVLMLLVMLVNSSAAGAARTLSVGSGSGTAGDTVRVPIELDDPSDVGGLAFTLNYDKDVLTFLGFEEAAPPPLSNGTEYKVPEGEVVNGTKYYNPYHKEEPYPNAGYDLASNSTLFFQANSQPALGRALMAAASALPLSRSSLFQAAFTIKQNTGFQGKSVINLSKSIIHNQAAGYPDPTPLPVLTGMPADQPEQMSDGTTYYPTPTYQASLQPGFITVTANTYQMSGTAYYGATNSTPAAGSDLTLFKKGSRGAYSQLIGNTEVDRNGDYSFSDLSNGDYKIYGEPGNPNYFSNNWYISVNSSDLTKTLRFNRGDVKVKGTVDNPFPGLKVQVRDALGGVSQESPVSRTDGSFFAGNLPGGYSVWLVYGSAEQQLETFQAGQSRNWNQALNVVSGNISGLQQDDKVLVTADSENATLEVSRMSTPATTAGNATYELKYLLPAEDYIVSATGAGLPVVYSLNATAFAEADRIDLSFGNATADIVFPTAKGNVQGAVTANGSALPAGSVVYAYELNTQAYAFTMTDASGAFSLDLIPGTYALYVLYENTSFYHTSGQATQSLAQADRLNVGSGSALTDKDITIKTCDQVLKGTVQLDTGDPVSALIRGWSPNRDSLAVDVTDAQGKYSLSGLCNGTLYTVQMDPFSGNYPIQTKTATAGINATLDFTVKTLNTLSGKVTDLNTGDPINRAMLYLEGVAGTLVGDKVHYSGNDGSYSIRGIPNGIYSLVVSHPNYTTWEKSLTIDANLVQDVQLVKGAWFQGKVTSGTELPGALVMARGGAQPAYGVTNSQGKYEIHGLQQQEYSLLAQKPGFLTQVKTENATSNGFTVDFTLSKPVQFFNLNGTIDNGTTGVNAQVVVVSKKKQFVKTTKTAANGQYLLANLPVSDDYRFVVIPAGDLQIYIEDPLGVEDEPINAGQTETNNVTLETGNAISGTVTGSGGSAFVFLYDSGNNQLQDYTKVAQDGSYAFKGLALGTSYKIYVVAPGNTPEWYNGKTSIGNADSVAAGSSNIDIDLTD